MTMMMMMNRNNNNNNNKTKSYRKRNKCNDDATSISRQMIVVFFLAIALPNNKNELWFAPMMGLMGGGSVFLVVHAQNIDHTCYPKRDYDTLNNKCLSLEDKKCDDPNLTPDGNDECRNQDCIDCNSYCQQFDYNCYGCLGAKGCYYCEGDATCQNSDLYTSSNKHLSCMEPSEYLLGGQDDPATSCLPPTSLTQDPLNGANYWMFDMIDLNQVREQLQVTGQGIKIRINDDGVDINNPDLQGTNKFDETNSCDQWQPNTNDGDGHGTTVAGIIVGNANNDFCSAGIAYDATFSACNFFAPGVPYSNLAYKVDTFDISQNSLGSPACSAGDIQGERRELQQPDGGSSAACPFTVPADITIEDPCDPTICNYQTYGGITTPCENAITHYCKDYYRIDENACADFNDLILGDMASCDYDKLPKSAIEALAIGIQTGRNGKGTVFVFASGNAFSEGDDINFSGWTNSRYTITVGAVGKDGKHTDYSTPGAALTVVGPAGDSNDASHLISTGLDGSCVDSGPGTSFACPVVSGVIALMLEARPDLTWRDVQGIIAATSTNVTDALDTSAAINSAGVWHSDWYGFGIINAFKAVEAALAWELWTPEQQAIGESKEENAVISNDGTAFISELRIESDDYPGFVAESVVVLLDLQHYNRGDLQLTLISPHGTHSILHAGKRPENSQLEEDERWKLMTVKNWGEDPVGTWQLQLQDRVVDGPPNTVNNNFRQWKITIYGRSSAAADVVVVDPIIIPSTTTVLPVVLPTPAAPPLVVRTPSALVPSSVHVPPGTSSLTPPHFNTRVQNVQRTSTSSSANLPAAAVVATSGVEQVTLETVEVEADVDDVAGATLPPTPLLTTTTTEPSSTSAAPAVSERPSGTSPTNTLTPPVPSPVPPPVPLAPVSPLVPSSVSSAPSVTSPTGVLDPSVVDVPAPTLPTGPTLMVPPAPTLPTGPTLLVPAPTSVVGTPSALVPSSVHVPLGTSSLTPPHLNARVQNVQRTSSSSFPGALANNLNAAAAAVEQSGSDQPTLETGEADDNDAAG